MRYDQEVIEEIRLANDIVSVVSEYVQLKQRGNSHFGLCPFHNEKSPSFSVHAQRQIYHCFGCGASGNVVSFIMQIENYGFVDALKYLADRVHINLEEHSFSQEAQRQAKQKAMLIDIHTQAARFYYENLKSKEGAIAKSYMDERKIMPAFRVKCGLGYAAAKGPKLHNFLSGKGFSDSDLVLSGLVVKSKTGKGYYDRFFSRLMFPILDPYGKVIAFGGRIIGEGSPKYLNSPETPIFNKSRNLYGLNFARKALKKRELIVVEGYMDAIAIYQAGFMNVVATLGTSLTSYHSRILNKFSDSAILLYDSDDAGIKAALRAIPLLTGSGMQIKIAHIIGAKDPDEFIKQQGAQAFAALLNSAQSHVAFQVACARNDFDIHTTQGLIGYTKAAAAIIAKEPSAIEQEAYASEIANVSNISKDAVLQEIKVLTGQPDAAPKPLKEGGLRQKTAYEGRKEPKGLLNAQKTLLALMSKQPEIAAKLAGHLTSSAFTNVVYGKLYGILSELASESKVLVEADIINYFEDLPDQRAVSEVLSVEITYTDFNQLEKDVNDQIRIIKSAQMEKEIQKFTQENASDLLQRALVEQRKLNKLYITLSDG